MSAPQDTRDEVAEPGRLQRLGPELVAKAKRNVDAWPPLTPQQRDALAALFASGGAA